MAYLYILYSSTLDRFYIGSTACLERRLSEHNRGQTRSTRRGAPWIPVFTKEYTNSSEALAIERKLKKQKSRMLLEGIVASKLLPLGW